MANWKWRKEFLEIHVFSLTLNAERWTTKNCAKESSRPLFPRQYHNHECITELRVGFVAEGRAGCNMMKDYCLEGLNETGLLY